MVGAIGSEETLPELTSNSRPNGLSAISLKHAAESISSAPAPRDCGYRGIGPVSVV
jgi:hypothetical protein